MILSALALTLALDPHPVATPPLATLAEAHDLHKKRRSRSSNSRRAALAIGTIVILGDGTECRVTHIAQDGTAWCEPIPRE